MNRFTRLIENVFPLLFVFVTIYCLLFCIIYYNQKVNDENRTKIESKEFNYNFCSIVEEGKLEEWFERKMTTSGDKILFVEKENKKYYIYMQKRIMNVDQVRRFNENSK